MMILVIKNYFDHLPLAFPFPPASFDWEGPANDEVVAVRIINIIPTIIQFFFLLGVDTEKFLSNCEVENLLVFKACSK